MFQSVYSLWLTGIGIFILPFPFAEVPSSAGSLTIKKSSQPQSLLQLSHMRFGREISQSVNCILPLIPPRFLAGCSTPGVFACPRISHYHLPPFPRSFSQGIVACSTWVAWCNFRSTLRQDLSPVRASKASISKDWAAMLHLYRSQSL